jgi:hypothetical protein
MKAKIEIVKQTVTEIFGETYHVFNDKRKNGRRLKFARIQTTEQQLRDFQQLLATKGVIAKVTSNIKEQSYHLWYAGLCVYIENN